MKFIVTGGAGFIGSNFLNLFVPRYPEHQFINVDALTYAANLQNLSSIADAQNYAFEYCDITNIDRVKFLFAKYSPDIVVHFAAESHVDRSISGPDAFINTNVIGTFNLLEVARATPTMKRFHHVSTDEVYGSLGKHGLFTEDSRYDPSSPYSASKAASDHLIRAYVRTYGIDATITNCSNNYGPLQHPEKLIPLTISKIIHRKQIPVYGKGLNIRDWLYVTDHCEAIWTVIHKGRTGETYNVGGNAEHRNIDVVKILINLVAEETGANSKDLHSLITYVTDRPGHDARYAINAQKIKIETGWQPTETFLSGLRKTVRWYLENDAKVEKGNTI